MKTKCLILLMFLLSSCVSYDNFDTNTAAGSFGLAQKLEEDERFEEALAQYRDVKNRFPYSKYAVMAELQMGEVNFKKEDYAQAQGAYQLFKELHPRHQKIDYVTYQIGVSIYNQLPESIDRDLALAPAAIKEFDVLLRDFPQSQYAQEAKKMRDETLKKMAEKELYIADFYYRTKKWQNSLVRYKKYLKEFPGHNRRPHALLRAGIAADKFGDPSQSSKLLRDLVEKFPTSKEAKKAKGML